MVLFTRIGLCIVLRPRQHSMGYMGDSTVYQEITKINYLVIVCF